MDRIAFVALVALGLTTGGALRAGPRVMAASTPCRFTVMPRVEGAIAPEALDAITRDYQERIAPSLLNDLKARCTERDSIVFEPRIVNGKLSDLGMPAMVWSSEARIEIARPGPR